MRLLFFVIISALGAFAPDSLPPGIDPVSLAGYICLQTIFPDTYLMSSKHQACKMLNSNERTFGGARYPKQYNIPENPGFFVRSRAYYTFPLLPDLEVYNSQRFMSRGNDFLIITDQCKFAGVARRHWLKKPKSYKKFKGLRWFTKQTAEFVMCPRYPNPYNPNYPHYQPLYMLLHDNVYPLENSEWVDFELGEIEESDLTELPPLPQIPIPQIPPPQIPPPQAPQPQHTRPQHTRPHHPRPHHSRPQQYAPQQYAPQQNSQQQYAPQQYAQQQYGPQQYAPQGYNYQQYPPGNAPQETYQNDYYDEPIHHHASHGKPHGKPFVIPQRLSDLVSSEHRPRNS